MSSVVISGDTSGAITLSAPAVAGTNTITLPALTGNVVLDTATQTLTNKTLTSPVISTITNTGTLTLPTTTGTLALTSGIGLTLINTTTFTSASAITVDGVFSSAYTNYLIVLNETAISGNFDLSIQFRTGGTTNTSSNYNAYGVYVTSGGTVTGVNQGSNPNANIGNSIDRPNTYLTYVYQPFASVNTQVNSTSVGGTRWRAIGSDFSATTSFDGFVITCGSNNHTGTLKVYGLS